MENVRCALCGEPIQPADKSFFRELPGMGLVRVHMLCSVKVRITRPRRGKPGS